VGLNITIRMKYHCTSRHSGSHESYTPLGQGEQRGQCIIIELLC
jgi:hypothetical protein